MKPKNTPNGSPEMEKFYANKNRKAENRKQAWKDFGNGILMFLGSVIIAFALFGILGGEIYFWTSQFGDSKSELARLKSEVDDLKTHADRSDADIQRVDAAVDNLKGSSDNNYRDMIILNSATDKVLKNHKESVEALDARVKNLEQSRNVWGSGMSITNVYVPFIATNGWTTNDSMQWEIPTNHVIFD